MRKIFSVLFVLFVYSGFCFAQSKITINGYVQDSENKEKLIGATIYESLQNKGTITNEYGYFSLTLNKSDSIHLTCSFIGYSTKIIRTFASTTINIELIKGVRLDEVVVTATHANNKRNELGVLRIPMARIKEMPSLFGEIDIMKAMQLMPGVNLGSEGKSDLFVRGGNSSQNLILLDDVPMYYVNHLGGFFSVFNADAINNVKLIKGGFPARYGGRLSSVLDVRMKEGNMQKYEVNGTIGLLSSKLSIEGPLIKEKTSFIISARKNILPFFKVFFDEGIDYNFYDINAKLNHKISDKDRLFLSYYWGDDVFGISMKQSSDETKDAVKWGNNLFAVRWNHIYNPKLFSNLTLFYTQYRYNQNSTGEYKKDNVSRNIENDFLSKVSDYSAKIDFDYNLASFYHIRFGISSIYHAFTPATLTYKQSGTNVTNIDFVFENKKLDALELVAYIENEFFISDKFSTNIGLRFSDYITIEKDFYNLEPRVLLSYSITKAIIAKAAYSKMAQYAHLLTYSGTGMPSEYWMPSTKTVPPELSEQYTIGISKTFKKDIEIGIDAYYKETDNLIAFKPGASFVTGFKDWQDIIEKRGKGFSRGIELLIQQNTEKYNAWISGTLSKTDLQFENINGGKLYPFRYDRRIQTNIAFIYNLNSRISISGTWTYASGEAITLPKGKYGQQDEDVFIYDGINSFRMKDYHRLDIGLNFTKKKKWGTRIWNISIINVYNHQNPYYYYFDREEVLVDVESDNGVGVIGVPGDMKLYQQCLFPFLPSISYSFKFNQ